MVKEKGAQAGAEPLCASVRTYLGEVNTGEKTLCIKCEGNLYMAKKGNKIKLFFNNSYLLAVMTNRDSKKKEAEETYTVYWP